MSRWQIAFCPEVHPEVKKPQVHSTAAGAEWFIKRQRHVFVELLALTGASSASRLGFMVNAKALTRQEEIGILYMHRLPHCFSLANIWHQTRRTQLCHYIWWHISLFLHLGWIINAYTERAEQVCGRQFLSLTLQKNTLRRGSRFIAATILLLWCLMFVCTWWI